MKHLSKGFSIIEILVVIVIMALVIGVGVSNFRDFGRRQQVDNFARILEGDLQSAAADAAAGRRLTGCNGAFQGNRVRFAVNGSNQSSSYTISSACSTASATSKTVTLPTNVYLTFNRGPSGGAVNLLFKPLQLGTDAQVGGLVITVNHSQNAQRATITISPTGEIR